MAASNGEKTRYQDVEFSRTTSTRNWGKDFNPQHHRHRQDGGFSPSAGLSPRLQNNHHAPKVIRTGGITGTLPSQSLLPPPPPSSTGNGISPATAINTTTSSAAGPSISSSSSTPQTSAAPQTPAAQQQTPQSPTKHPAQASPANTPNQVSRRKHAQPVSQPKRDEGILYV